MNEQPIQLNDGTELDPKVVKVVRTIRQLESGGQADPYNAVGDNGNARGAYQFNEAKGKGWKKYAQEFLGNPDAPMDPGNQNKVAYYQVKKWKDQGLQPDEIDALWNGAKKDPVTNRYTHLNSDRARKFSETLRGFVDAPIAQAQAATAHGLQQASTQNAQSQEKEGLLSSIFRGVTSPVVTMLARPFQAGAEILGATPEQVNAVSAKVPYYGKDGALDVPQSGKDLLKDVGRAAETISLGLPAKGLVQAVKAGALAGAGAGLEKTGDVGGALKGGLLGSALGLGGGAIGKAMERLPKSLVNSAFKGLSPEQTTKLLREGHIGTGQSILKNSTEAVRNYGRQIDDILKNTKEFGAADNAVWETLSQYPEFRSKKGVDKMLTKVKDLISPNNTLAGEDRGTIVAYIDKIKNGSATLYEKNKVRSALDHATKGGYSKLAKALNPSAGHDLGMTFADALRNEVKTAEPATIPIFDEFSKEIGIQKAIDKAVNKNRGGLVRWRDIVPFVTGNAAFGPAGGLMGVAAERASENPAVQFGAAKVLQKGGGLLNPVLNRSGLLPLATNRKSEAK